MNDRALFESCLKQRYPHMTFDKPAMENLYRGWWLHKNHASQRLTHLEQQLELQRKQLEQLMGQAS